jgi:hypothetical protein
VIKETASGLPDKKYELITCKYFACFSQLLMKAEKFATNGQQAA